MPQPSRQNQPEVGTLPATHEISAPSMAPIEIKRADLPKQDLRSYQGARRAYWCGAYPLPNMPFANYHLGGREFVLRDEDVQTEPGEPTQRFRRFGKILFLTDGQRDAILSDITRKVMRGRGPGAKIHATNHADFKPHPSDHPIGEYIYFIAVSPEFQTPAFRKGEVPRGAVPVVRPIPQEAVA